MNFQLSKTVSTNILGLIERILQFIEVQEKIGKISFHYDIDFFWGCPQFFPFFVPRRDFGNLEFFEAIFR